MTLDLLGGVPSWNFGFQLSNFLARERLLLESVPLIWSWIFALGSPTMASSTGSLLTFYDTYILASGSVRVGVNWSFSAISDPEARRTGDSILQDYARA